MVKYYLTYKGIEGDVYLFEIYEEGFSGEPTEIHGYVNHNYASRKDLVQPTIASSLDISLEADENLTLQDLYTEEESKFKCSLKRNEQTIFYGILKPDGIWEDFVSNRWEISMDAMDGLSILKDLSFVKDDGKFYSGKITQFDAVKQCLKRIGYELPINISTDLPVYDGFSGTDTILKSVLMNADRFYQEKKTNQIMDCEAVLKSVLEPYSATVLQMNGEWWIFRSIDVKNQMNFYRYDGENKTDVVWNASLNIGSHIDQYKIFHCNANQKKSINPSTQAFRVNYKYGEVKNVFKNLDLIFNTDYTGEGWILTNVGNAVTILERGFKVSIERGNEQGDSGISGTILKLDQSVAMKEGDDISLVIDFNLNKRTPRHKSELQIYISTENYVYEINKWVLKSASTGSPSFNNYFQDNGNNNISISFDNVPENSAIDVKIDVDLTFDGEFANVGDIIEIKFNSVKIQQQVPSALKGEFHTAQRMTRISSVTKDDKTVSVGDSISDFYYGTLYKSNGEPTEKWGGKPLLQRMVEDALRIAPRPMYFFEGDVFGYFPYLSHVLINNISGKYQVSKYSFDTRKNVNNANFSEFDKVDLVQGVDYRYEFEYDYGSETKVTIKS